MTKKSNRNIDAEWKARIVRRQTIWTKGLGTKVWPKNRWPDDDVFSTLRGNWSLARFAQCGGHAIYGLFLMSQVIPCSNPGQPCGR